MPDLINGLGGSAGFGEGTLARNDDFYTGAIDITSVFGAGGLNFFGHHYTELFVNNNGNITFGEPTGDYTPDPIGENLSFPIIAALWTDLDTRGSIDPNLQKSPLGNSTGSNLVYYDVDPVHHTFTATWDDVDFFASQTGHPAAFQIRLTDVGGGDFDIEFIYENVQPDGGNFYVNNSRAGYSPGEGQRGGDEIAISGTPDMADIDVLPGNTGVPGYYLFHVRGGQVSDDEPPPPAIHPVTVGVQSIGIIPEGDDGVTPVSVVITRAGENLNGASVVNWQLDGDPADFAPGQALSGSVAFAPFQTEATVVIGIQGDQLYEPDEQFHFRLTQATFGAESWEPGVEGIGIILNDDPAVTFEFAGPVMQAEGLLGPSPIEFVVTRTGDLTRSSTVDWVVELTGTADEHDLDPDTLAGRITFAAGEAEATIRVNAIGDLRPEPDETFTVHLTSSTTGSTATEEDLSITGTILDDDGRHSRLVAAPSVLVQPEGDSGATTFNVSVMRVGDLSTAITIPYHIAPGGDLGADEIQTALDGTVTFAAGASIALLHVAVSGDLTPETNESFVVSLGGGSFDTLHVTGLVMNDDKVAASGGGSATPPPASPPGPGEISSFMSHLMGGSLWSDGAAL